MRMQFDRSVLQAALQAVQKVTGRKSTMPVLSHVLMELKDSGCTLSATDLSIATRMSCAMTGMDLGDAGGAVLMPAEKLYQIVQSLPVGDVVIEADDKTANLACAGFKSRLNVLPAADFPQLPVVPDVPALTLPRAVLREMVRKTQFAVSADDTRFYLNGAQLATTGDLLRMASTDGHRLAIAEAPLQAEANSAILPTATLRELAAMLEGDGADLQYRRGENHLFFQSGDRLLVSRIIDAQFPNYMNIVPKGNDKRAVIAREPLLEALKRVSIMSDLRSRAVKLALEGEVVRITTSSADSGDAADSVSQQYGGAPITMSFNASYLQDFLNAVDGETVSLELKDEVSQALLKAVGTEGYDYTYVLMPMRI